MSEELKSILEKVNEEISRENVSCIRSDFSQFKTLLLTVQKTGKFDLLISAQGADQTQAKKDEKLLDLLERANLVQGQTRFTHRNVYRRYELTGKGTEIANRLAAET